MTMELASLIWNSERHCIVNTVEHTTPCDGNGDKILQCSWLECKQGGLVIQRQEEIKFELQDLPVRALIPSVVRNEPQLYETEGMSTW